MEEEKKQDDIEELLSLSKEELKKIFNEMTASEISSMLDLLNGEIE